MENEEITTPDINRSAGTGTEISEYDAMPGTPTIVERYENTGDGVQIRNLNGGLTVHNHFEITPELAAACIKTLGIQLLGEGIVPNPGHPVPVSHAMEWAALSSEEFCLFVLENEDYSCGAFSMAKSRSLERYTRQDIKERYKKLGSAAIDAIKQMPCIFARKNRYFKSTVFDHPVVLGRVTAIDVQDENIRFKFDAYQPFYQSVINDNIDTFMLASAPLRNELDEEHWSIRKGNLKEIIRAFDIEVK